MVNRKELNNYAVVSSVKKVNMVTSQSTNGGKGGTADMVVWDVLIEPGPVLGNLSNEKEPATQKKGETS